MEIKSNVCGTVISIKDGIKILSEDGNVHYYGKLKQMKYIKLGKHVIVGMIIGETEEKSLHYEVYKYKEQIAPHDQEVLTTEKFEVNAYPNHVVLNIIDKYKLKITPTINIESIIVDYVRISTSKKSITGICLLGNYVNNDNTYTTFLNLDDFNFNEVAQLLATMINLYKPKEIKLDTRGMGIGVKEALEIELKKLNITYNDNGLLEYDRKELEVKDSNESECVLSTKVNGDKMYFVTASSIVNPLIKRKVMSSIETMLNSDSKVVMITEWFELKVMERGSLLHVKSYNNTPSKIKKEVLSKINYAIKNGHNLIMIPDLFEVKYLDI
ncbi:hypothetical protein [Lysinibacillus sp. NPDC086135]|uniref:hypothetical protein n=1 Tax=Lysinibacillus sp. NPDC086135 TaxID=3364130 RepID=UPI0037F280C5